MITALIASAVLAQAAAKPATPEVTLLPGSPAPIPHVEKWVRGDEPKFFQPGKVYVVEFWATWCGPCKASMPHLSKLNDEYSKKGVTIVGISDEEIPKVTDFLNQEKWQQDARYTLGTDPDKSTYKDYMTAAGQNGIPTAFIVKDNTVQWIGHPMTMDEPLAKVVAGTWDVAAAKTKFVDETREAKVLQDRGRAMSKARQAKDWDGLVKMLDTAIKDTPSPMNVGLKMQKFQVLVGVANKPEAGYALGRELAGEFKDNPQLLNALAWFVLDDKTVENRDLDFAMSTAKAAVTATKGENAEILDTLARAYWETGDKTKAVETQQKAVGLAEGEMAAPLSETLKKYRDGTAPKPAARKTA